VGFESVLELVVLECVRCKTYSEKKDVSFHVLPPLWMYRFKFYLPIVVSSPYWSCLPSFSVPDDDTIFDFLLLLLEFYRLLSDFLVSA